MGRDIAAGFEKYYGEKAADNWVQWIKEFAGSMILILVASKTSFGFAGFEWAISYVVLSIVFGENHHFNSFVTFYKAFTGSMCCVQGIFYLGAQFLGAFVAGHLGTALDIDADTVTRFGISDWKDGLQAFIAINIFLWTYNHSGKVGDSMPRGIFMIASIGMCFMFSSTFVFSYHRCFQSKELIGKTWAIALWGAAACICTHVKAKFMGIEDKWFWEA